MKTIIILITILFSINIYGERPYFLQQITKESTFSIKGGINYSIAELNYSSMDKVSYKLGGLFFLSWKRDITDDFYWSIDLGLNVKGTIVNSEPVYPIGFYALELPLIIGYNILEKINLYSGVYASWIFMRASDFGNSFDIINNNGKFNTDYGFILGIEYNYKNILFDFRFEQGYGRLNHVSEEGDQYYTDNRQFIFMVGYQF